MSLNDYSRDLNFASGVYEMFYWLKTLPGKERHFSEKEAVSTFQTFN